MSGSIISAFLDPSLCANNENEPCTAKDVKFRCSGCNMVQYCSDMCQKADWSRHKKQCRSPFMKGTWIPEWYRQCRKPSFLTEPATDESGNPTRQMIGQLLYPWGNMPALDVLRVDDNEGKIQATDQDFNLLFAASGDLRNVIKTISGLPKGYSGECAVAVNDIEFIIVARNVIMLLIAIKFELEVATPLITHLWYSALLPFCMIQTIQSQIMSMIQQVCERMPDFSDDQLHTHTFEVEGRKVCVILEKHQWRRLATFCDIPENLTAEKAQKIRRAILLAPDRIDYRDRRIIGKPGNVRQGESHFRDTGVFLPYGCSTRDFDTPNPALYPNNEWPTRDDASPREGWLYDEYMQSASEAKADEIGAIFFHIRRLLLQFCQQLRDARVSFRFFNMDVRKLGEYLGGMKFDRIEISNICDEYFLGLPACLEVFSPLLKERSQNPRATLLMLFMLVVRETQYAIGENHYVPSLDSGIELVERYSPIEKSDLLAKLALFHTTPHPDFLLRAYERGLFGPWDEYFDIWLKIREASQVAQQCGVAIKPMSKHTIIEAWPYRLSEDSTRKEFEVRRASSVAGYERYLEVHKLDEGEVEVASDDTASDLGSADV